MKVELANYRVQPRVFNVGTTQKVVINPRGKHAHFNTNSKYTIEMIPTEKSLDATLNADYTVKDYIVNQDGSLELEFHFDFEQMYFLRVRGDHLSPKEFRLYALNDDLYHRVPLKGDLHSHSYYSDGCEEPSVVVANYRKNGFDFMGLTDHHLWHPSKEAVDLYKGIPSDITLFYGEEIHIMGGYIHAVNFGGDSSVNEYYKQNTELCEKQVSELIEQSPFDEEMTKTDYARRKWIADKIVEFNGLSILVHPYWLSCAYNMRTEMTEALLVNNVYQAFELLGGQSVNENSMQLHLYNHIRAKGYNIPIVGSSDSHGTEPKVYFTEQFTIVFSSSREHNDIINSIKDGYSVAVEDYNGQLPRCHGDFRMSKFALFLIEEYYPEYIEISFEQGRLLKLHMTNEEDCMQLLNLIQGRTTKYYNDFFGR